MRENRKQMNMDGIGIKNDILFCMVFANPEDCKELLERILGMKISEIRVLQSQKDLKNNLFQKGVRLDIYAKDSKGNVYDIEMQLTDTGNLDVRSRYYHSEMDGYQIEKGENYDDLKQSIVIFLCDFDMFHKNQSLYTFETRCSEDPTIRLNDRRKTIFVNLNGNRDGLSDKLKNLLDYLATSTPTDAFTKHIESEVSKVKSDDEWRGNFMTLEQKIEEECRFARKQALAEGLAQGHARGLSEGRESGFSEGRIQGEEQKLLFLISKKLEKGKRIAQIADECEETEERIRELIEKL